MDGSCYFTIAMVEVRDECKNEMIVLGIQWGTKIIRQVLNADQIIFETTPAASWFFCINCIPFGELPGSGAFLFNGTDASGIIVKEPIAKGLG